MSSGDSSGFQGNHDQVNPSERTTPPAPEDAVSKASAEMTEKRRIAKKKRKLLVKAYQLIHNGTLCLPVEVVKAIVDYAPEGRHLGETSPGGLQAVSARIRLDMMVAAKYCESVPIETANMGFQPGEGVGHRPVQHIAVTNVRRFHREFRVGYRVVERGLQRVVTNTIPHLLTITVEGNNRGDSSKVSAILAPLLNQPAEGRVVASLLQTITVSHSSNSVRMIGAAAIAGVLPNLRELSIAQCHANDTIMKDLTNAISKGRLRELRSVVWDGLAAGANSTGVNNLMLKAFGNGRCSKIEVLSFIDNTGFDQKSLSNLSMALKGCPKLSHLRMDTTMKPWKQLKRLKVAIDKGYVPSLNVLEIRMPSHLGYRFQGLIRAAVKRIKLAVSRKVIM